MPDVITYAKFPIFLSSLEAVQRPTIVTALIEDEILQVCKATALLKSLCQMSTFNHVYFVVDLLVSLASFL